MRKKNRRRNERGNEKEETKEGKRGRARLGGVALKVMPPIYPHGNGKGCQEHNGAVGWIVG